MSGGRILVQGGLVITRDRATPDLPRGDVLVEGKKILDKVTKLTDQLKANTDKLEKLLSHEGNGSAEKHAKYFRDVVIPAMNKVREAADELECIIPHEMWPLATYREMLFIK